MVKIFNTAKLSQKTVLNADEISWVYNGLDCCVTAEVRNVLREQLAAETPNVQETYDVAMQKLAPVGYMCMTGLRVDEAARQETLRNYKKELAVLETRFNEMCVEIIGYPINWRSPAQLDSLFYQVFKLKAVRKRNAQGYYMPTTNREAMEKFQSYFYIRPFAAFILSMRDLGKKIGFLETEIDKDSRIRTSLNIAGTDTGRFASSFSALGTGTNLQNVENALRAPFIPDEGMIFVNVDLEQADARNVAARIWQIFYESHGPEAAGKFLDACESGDLHTTVTSMCWRELPWPDPWDLKLARAVADTPFFGTKTYRDAAKALGHGTNYYGLPVTMSRHTKTEVSIIQNFQVRYFRAFPLIGNYEKDLKKDDWHGWIFRQLRDVGYLNNLFGRRRFFFDRYKDPRTLRAAIAYDPQSSTGEFLDRGWLNLWNNMAEARLHLPVHDSILFSLPFEGLYELLPRALALLRVELELFGGRKFSIPLEAKVGWNWADVQKDKKTGRTLNEHGLVKWSGKEERQPPKRNRLHYYLR